MSRWVDIGIPSEIKNLERKIIELNNIPIAIFNLNGIFYAIEDNCPHQNLPLADGLVENGNITCPYHGATFCIATGKFLSPPACENLHTYPTRILDGKIQIQI